MLLSCDVVVTGIGVVTPIGIGCDKFWESIVSARSGITLLDPPGQVGDRAWLVAAVNDFNPKVHGTPRKSLKVMSREHQLAFAASKMACDQAAIGTGTLDPDRLGTIFGSEEIFSETNEIEEVVRHCSINGQMNPGLWGANASNHMNPLWMLKSLPNMPACHVGIGLDARGPNNTIVSEETSGLVALIEAAAVIQRDLADVMIVGVSSCRVNPTRMLQRHEAHFSRNYENPHSACRPFDSARDGTVIAEGAATIVIERRSHAEQRQVPILARLLSWSNNFAQPNKAWSGSKQAVARSLTNAIQSSGRSISEFDHINSNAKGVIETDANEAAGIAQAVGKVPVTAIKGYIGDAIGSSGMIELCASLIGMQYNLVPATLNHIRTASDCPIRVIQGEPKPWERPLFAKICTTPHGQAATVVMERM